MKDSGDSITKTNQETEYCKQNKQCKIISSIIIKPAKKITTSTDLERAAKITLENYKENHQQSVENLYDSIINDKTPHNSLVISLERLNDSNLTITQQENIQCNTSKNNVQHTSVHIQRSGSEDENSNNQNTSIFVYPGKYLLLLTILLFHYFLNFRF